MYGTPLLLQYCFNWSSYMTLKQYARQMISESTFIMWTLEETFNWEQWLRFHQNTSLAKCWEPGSLTVPRMTPWWGAAGLAGSHHRDKFRCTSRSRSAHKHGSLPWSHGQLELLPQYAPSCMHPEASEGLKSINKSKNGRNILMVKTNITDLRLTTFIVVRVKCFPLPLFRPLPATTSQVFQIHSCYLDTSGGNPWPTGYILFGILCKVVQSFGTRITSELKLSCNYSF